MPFASGDAHSVAAMRSEASPDAEAVAPIGGLSERSQGKKGGDDNGRQEKPLRLRLSFSKED